MDRTPPRGLDWCPRNWWGWRCLLLGCRPRSDAARPRARRAEPGVRRRWRRKHLSCSLGRSARASRTAPQAPERFRGCRAWRSEYRVCDHGGVIPPRQFGLRWQQSARFPHTGAYGPPGLPPLGIPGVSVLVMLVFRKRFKERFKGSLRGATNAFASAVGTDSCIRKATASRANTWCKAPRRDGYPVRAWGR
jgi:hypothetical protein